MAENKTFENQIRILIVDDDQDFCELTKNLLTQEGYIVDHLTDPALVENQLRLQDYHIILLDLKMPKIDGLEVLRRIRKLDSDVAIIIFTAYPSVHTAVESLKMDVSDYLDKPYSEEQMLHSIAKVCRKKGYITNSEHELHSTIGRNIRTLRKDQVLTLKQMARRTGLSVSLLSQIERAESSASVSSLFKVANALNCKLHELFGEF